MQQLVRLACSYQRAPSLTLSAARTNDQVENYPEVNLDPRGQEMKDSALPPGQIAAEVLGIVCLVLVSTVVKTIVLIPATTKESEKNDFSSEQNDCSNVTKTQKAYPCGPCPKGWFKYSNNCYYFSAEKSTWKESVTACHCMDSQLLFIDTEEEMKFMKSISVLSWIGVYRNDSGQPWTRVNGSAIQLEIKKPVPADYHCLMLESKYYAEKCEDKNMYYCKDKI